MKNEIVPYLVLICMTLVFVEKLQAVPRLPQLPLPELSPVIYRELFDEPIRAGISNAEVVVPNYGVLRESWSGYSLQRLGNVTPFVIASLNETGRVQVATDNASVRFWFMPYWSSASTGEGQGPGVSARLLEFVAVDGKQSAVLWSLQASEDGSLIYLSGAGQDGEHLMLKAEIAWFAGEWHQIVLTYGAKGTELVLDGEKVAEGAATIVVPPKIARLVVGSSINGEESAGGEIDELFCFSKPLKMAFHYMAFKEQAALGPVTEAELQALAERHAKLKAQREARKASEGESGDGGMMLRMSGPSASCVTNGPVYLTNVLATLTANDGWTVYFDIAGGTNEVVYDIFSTPELAGNDVTNSVWTWLETGMTCETHYFTNQPTNQMFYILTVPGADRDGDGMYDGWEWKHFGTLEQPAVGDYDGDGISNLLEYQSGFDPNTLMYVVRSETAYVNSNSAAIVIESLEGVPSQMAVVVNSTNFDNASWTAFNSNAVINLGTLDGRYDVWLGVRNRTQGQKSGWERHTFFRDAASPLLVVENPVDLTSRPHIQIEGHCPEPIESLLSYSIFNADGDFTNQMAYVKHQFFDTNEMSITTNWWQCYDVRLAVGTNIIVVRARDKAGNGGAVTNVVVFDVSSDTNAPMIELHWPQDGELVSGTSFTLRGWLDDPTARVAASISDSNGVVTEVEGLAERNGLLWVEGLPLVDGTNIVTLTATDAAGNAATTNINIIKSDVELTINDLPENELPSGVISVVSGTINNTNYTVWVNGVRATMDGNSWSAESVPLNEGGTALVQARAIPNTDNGGNGVGGGGGAGNNPSSPNGKTKEEGKELRSYIRIKMFEYHEKVELRPPDDGFDITTFDRVWQYNKPSKAFWTGTWLASGQMVGTDYQFPADQAVIDGPGGLGGPNKLGSRTDWWIPGGSYTTQNIPPLPIRLWHYDFHRKDALRRPSLNSTDKEDVDMTVQVAFELITGGKAKSSRVNLFRIAANGETTEDDRPVWYAQKPTKPIPSTSIKVFGKSIFTDGFVFIPLVDNTTNEFTVEAPFKNYTFSVSQQKFRLKSWTYACKPDDHERRTVGVGEEVNLFFVVPGSNPESPTLTASWSTPDGV